MRITGPLGLVIGLVAALAARTAPAAEVDYLRDVRPILANRCYACHGPDAGQRQADLRLDLREAALAEAIVPGHPDRSPLVARVASADPEMRMPPPDSKKPPLTEREIEILRTWIADGAPYDLHWAYRPLVRPPVPQVKRQDWVRHPIDAFVAARHEALGYEPAPEADRRTLIRRLSFDLRGLPPAPEEIDAFLADTSPDAYANLVQRMLDSPHYGERMALYWLDLVRFADTGGYHSDNHRDVFLYRDWVIEAFNRNKPFDRFTREQLAGDLLPDADRQSRIASGYNRLLMTTEEGGAQAKEYTAKYAADRVRNVSMVWLGATMGCAECHDHKFDPYTMRDFYSFAAFFADVEERAVGRQPQTKMPTPQQQAELDRLAAEIAEAKRQLAATTPELIAARHAWDAQMRQALDTDSPMWEVVVPQESRSAGGASFQVQDDRSVLVSGANPAQDTYEITLHTQREKITGLRLEALPDPSLGNQSLGRGNGNFVLTELHVAAGSLVDAPQRVKIAAAAADFSQKDFGVELAIDDKPQTGWAVEGQSRREPRTAVFTLAEPIAGGQGTVVVVRMEFQSPHAQHTIGRFRLALTSSAAPGAALQLPAEVAAALRVAPPQRSEAQQNVIEQHYRGIAPLLAPVREKLAQLESAHAGVLAQAPETLITVATTPRVVRILPRGNWLDDSGPVVAPAVPEFLGKLDLGDRRATRLDLANWLVRPDHPLVSRVMVNRLWKLLFGRGLVKSVDDFGAQGTVPTHPELLDWLATEYIASGWDTKDLLKQMALSATYRQSSRPAPQTLQRDPANDWLARQNRFRLDAELVRDGALAISGLLVPTISGPSVKPYQPEGYWDNLNFPRRTYVHDKNENQYRRGLYTYWQRTFHHPSLAIFDAPSREECTAERPRSNTPLQALVLLNDPTYVEAARVLAERVLHYGGNDDAARLDFLFRRALGRTPRDEERRLMMELFQRHRQQYQADPQSAGQLLGVGEYRPPADVDPAEAAAWTSVARAVLNLHETITRY